MFEATSNLRREEANAAINLLSNWGMLIPNNDVFKLTPVMHELLREMEEREVR